MESKSSATEWEGLYKVGVSMYIAPMMTLLKILAVCVLGYMAIAAWVYFSQHRLLYFPRRTLETTPAEIGLEYEDVVIANGLGTRIHGWWIPHENARFTFLFAHGNGGNISHRLESFRIFHDLGLSVMIYDYSGYGQSSGEASEQGTRADARAAWDWLVNEKKIAPESIILFGRSLGGAVTAGLAGDLHKDGTPPAGLILESTFTSVPDMGAHLYPWLPVRKLASYQYNSMADLADVRLPALFAHSPDDDIIPYPLGRRLYESYKGPKSFFELRGDHNAGYMLMGEAYPEGLDSFLTTLERKD